MTVEYSSAFLFSSDPKNGAVAVGTSGSQFSVQFNNPISIPAEAKSCTVEVQSSTIWNNSFNISAAIGNNVIQVIHDGVPLSPIIIPDGQFSLSALDSFLGRELVRLGLDSKSIKISGDSATGKSVLSFMVGFQIDLTGSNLFRELLGFDMAIVPSNTSVASYQYSDTPAQFNRVNSYILASTLVSDGLQVNNGAGGILAAIPILAKSGSLSIYEPANPLRIDASELVGRPKQFLMFRLLDQNRREVSTNGEFYTFTVVIRYSK